MRNALLAVVLLALAPACGRSAAAPPSPSPDPVASADPSGPDPAEEARKTFDSICASCHGQSGMGNGPGAAQLNPKPRNYTDKAWQKSVTDDQIKQTILLGGAAVGKSPSMPAQPQLKDKPAVVAELVKIVRSFGN
jgi:cytochrome c553